MKSNHLTYGFECRLNPLLIKKEENENIKLMIMLENLKPAEDLKKLERRAKTEGKKMASNKLPQGE